MSYDVSDPIAIAGEPYVVATVTGQSFVLNQIRRMIGLAVWVAREWLPLQMVDVALSPLQLVVPRIPGEPRVLCSLKVDAFALHCAPARAGLSVSYSFGTLAILQVLDSFCARCFSMATTPN